MVPFLKGVDPACVAAKWGRASVPIKSSVQKEAHLPRNRGRWANREEAFRNLYAMIAENGMAGKEGSRGRCEGVKKMGKFRQVFQFHMELGLNGVVK